MSKAGNTMALPPRALKFSRDWITRPVFALLLGGGVIAAIYFDRPYLEIVVAVAALLAAREWHRLVGEGRFAVELIATAVVVLLSLATFLYRPEPFAPLLVLGAGALVVLAVGFVRRGKPLWHAAGAVYIGVPSLAVLALRDFTHHGGWVLASLFLIVWATDTGAFLVGNLAGGPKLAPVLSPNKTWSGFVGGTAAAAAVQAILVAVLGGHLLPAALFGAAIAVVAHAGDLFESMVKRRFHKKDSGSIIPGHGGVLDRIDSTLFAAVAFEIAVFVFHLDPLFGAYR